MREDEDVTGEHTTVACVSSGSMFVDYSFLYVPRERSAPYQRPVILETPIAD